MTRAVPGGGSPAGRAVRWERSRLRHDDALRAAGMVPWRSGRRLRYSCLTPAGPLVLGGAALVLAGYAGWALLGHASSAGVVRVAVFVLLLVALATNRAGVTEAGLSFDVRGLRQMASFGFVPLWAVGEVRCGARPAGWPRGRWHGAPWPGRGRVHVRYADQYAVDRVRSAWVRDPARYAETVLGGRAEPRRKRLRRR
jgi:hypothetical protein